VHRAFLCGAILICVCRAADTRLVDAVRDRDLSAVQSLIAEHADVNEARPDGSTALAWAAWLNEQQIFEALLKAGAKIETSDDYGETPLTLACANGNAAMIRDLLDAGANAGAMRRDGATALMIAARSGSVDATRMLLEKGAAVDAPEARGQTALMWAAAEGHAEVAALLLARGANPNSASRAGFTPLIFAARKGEMKTVLELIRGHAEVNQTVLSGQSALEIALLDGKTEIAGLLLDHGAGVNAADKEGITPLHAAAQAGDVLLVKRLLTSGANVNARTAAIPQPTGKTASLFLRLSVGELTPLHIAARANRVDVMRALMAAGADPRLKAQDGATLLISAAASGHVEAVRYAYTLDQGVNSANQNGTTAAHAAISAFHTASEDDIVDVLRFLADHGANLDAKDIRGRTPMKIAGAIPLEDVTAALSKMAGESRHATVNRAGP